MKILGMLVLLVAFPLSALAFTIQEGCESAQKVSENDRVLILNAIKYGVSVGWGWNRYPWPAPESIPSTAKLSQERPFDQIAADSINNHLLLKGFPTDKHLNREELIGSQKVTVADLVDIIIHDWALDYCTSN